jgi:hypothetical protein
MQRPFVVHNVYDHSMENNLYNYLKIKMHNHIIEKDFNKIIVVGEYNRKSDISKYEKKNKKFNWQRPTATIKKNCLYIQCPPGNDYVMHYGSLIATYLAINNKDFKKVYYILPTEHNCKELIEKSNLKNLNIKKIVITGYGLETIAGKKGWLGKGTFLYKNIKFKDKEVTFLGCKHSIWGDIAERLVSFLADELNVKKIVYIGKLGGINPKLIPNKNLATGDSSYLKRQVIKWDNIFKHTKCNILKRGLHYTSPSTILETKKWLEQNRNFDFVDPELGYMAKAANKSKIKFGYLHIISNNLSHISSENLSNERLKSIITKRKKLLKKITKLIKDSI